MCYLHNMNLKRNKKFMVKPLQYVTHFRLNIWLHNSVTVSESNQYLINRSLKALSTKSAVFYSAFTSSGCLVNLDLMCP